MHPWFYAKLAQKILNVLHSRFQTKCPRVESDKKKKSLKEKSEELRCPYCDIIQSNKSSLSYHITTIHYPQNLDFYEIRTESISLDMIKAEMPNDIYLQMCKVFDIHITH